MKGQPDHSRDRERWFNNTRPAFLRLRSATAKTKKQTNKQTDETPTKENLFKPKIVWHLKAQQSTLLLISFAKVCLKLNRKKCSFPIQTQTVEAHLSHAVLPVLFWMIVRFSSCSSRSPPYLNHLCPIVSPAFDCAQLCSPSPLFKGSSSPSASVGLIHIVSALFNHVRNLGFCGFSHHVLPWISSPLETSDS